MVGGFAVVALGFDMSECVRRVGKRNDSGRRTHVGDRWEEKSLLERKDNAQRGGKAYDQLLRRLEGRLGPQLE